MIITPFSELPRLIKNRITKMHRSLQYKLLLFVIFISLFSCEEILLEDDISKNEITLVAPANNAQFFSTGVIFSWETVPNATQYHLQIAKPDFNNTLQIVLDTILTTRTFTHQLNIGKYEWRVKALNSAYETPYKSRFFTIVSNEDFQNNTVALITPTNNYTTNRTTQNLSWQSIIGATSYQVQILDGNNSIINNQVITTTSIDYTFAQGNYNWKVRASNGTQQTLYSGRSILVDTTVPNTPILKSPNDASTTANTSINFQWNRVPILGSTEKDSIYIYTDKTLTQLKLKEEVNNSFTKILETGTYYWFMKSFDQAGNSSEKSVLFSFTIE
jgi:hypothetical protein